MTAFLLMAAVELPFELSIGHIASHTYWGGVNLLAIILGSRKVLSVSRTPLLGE